MTINMTSLGIMSGTSFDGVDLALCRFAEKNGKWDYTVLKADTLTYPERLKKIILNAHTLSPADFLLLNNEYGAFLGQCCNDFLKDQEIKPDIISSHGHTIFHQPQMKFTYQLGNGAEIAAATKITTVCDFRTLDVAMNGQGAPLVPIGDELLFGNYTYCLNIGGIANLSVNKNGIRKAWDVSPANMALNYLAGLEGKVFDRNGEMARSGKFMPLLFKKLNLLTYYSTIPPKSLGREWFETQFMPVVDSFRGAAKDKLHTVTKHIAYQISLNMRNNSDCTVLCTGGGCHNIFLISSLQEYLDKTTVFIPDNTTIDFKEAIIFAFLGVLRVNGRVNSLMSVTGADSDSSSGIIFKIN